VAVIQEIPKNKGYVPTPVQSNCPVLRSYKIIYFSLKVSNSNHNRPGKAHSQLLSGRTCLSAHCPGSGGNPKPGTRVGAISPALS
jgi:hypothetical protein